MRAFLDRWRRPPRIPASRIALIRAALRSREDQVAAEFARRRRALLPGAGVRILGAFFFFGLGGLGFAGGYDPLRPALFTGLGALLFVSAIVRIARGYRCPLCDRLPETRKGVSLHPVWCPSCGIRLRPIIRITDPLYGFRERERLLESFLTRRRLIPAALLLVATGMLAALLSAVSSVVTVLEDRLLAGMYATAFGIFTIGITLLARFACPACGTRLTIHVSSRSVEPEHCAECGLPLRPGLGPLPIAALPPITVRERRRLLRAQARVRTPGSAPAGASAAASGGG